MCLCRWVTGNSSKLLSRTIFGLPWLLDRNPSHLDGTGKNTENGKLMSEIPAQCCLRVMCSPRETDTQNAAGRPRLPWLGSLFLQLPWQGGNSVKVWATGTIDQVQGQLSQGQVRSLRTQYQVDLTRISGVATGCAPLSTYIQESQMLLSFCVRHPYVYML